MKANIDLTFTHFIRGCAHERKAKDITNGDLNGVVNALAEIENAVKKLASQKIAVSGEVHATELDIGGVEEMAAARTAELENELRLKDHILDHKDHIIDGLRAEFRSNDRIIEHLQADNRNKDRDIEQLQAQAHAHRGLFANRQAVIANMQATIDRLNAQNQVLQRESDAAVRNRPVTVGKMVRITSFPTQQ